MVCVKSNFTLYIRTFRVHEKLCIVMVTRIILWFLICDRSRLFWNILDFFQARKSQIGSPGRTSFPTLSPETLVSHERGIKPIPNNKFETLPDWKSLQTTISKLMKIAESSPVENTVEKGEIARYKQFLLFPQCFQKTCPADTLKPGLVWERVKSVAVSILKPQEEISIKTATSYSWFLPATDVRSVAQQTISQSDD